MNPQILLYLEQALVQLPQAIAGLSSVAEAVTAAAGHVTETMAAVKRMQAENRDPTAAEWAALAEKTNALLARLNAA